MLTVMNFVILRKAYVTELEAEAEVAMERIQAVETELELIQA